MAYQLWFVFIHFRPKNKRPTASLEVNTQQNEKFCHPFRWHCWRILGEKASPTSEQDWWTRERLRWRKRRQEASATPPDNCSLWKKKPEQTQYQTLRISLPQVMMSANAFACFNLPVQDKPHGEAGRKTQDGSPGENRGDLARRRASAHLQIQQRRSYHAKVQGLAHKTNTNKKRETRNTIRPMGQDWNMFFLPSHHSFFNDDESFEPETKLAHNKRGKLTTPRYAASIRVVLSSFLFMPSFCNDFPSRFLSISLSVSSISARSFSSAFVFSSFR